MPEVQGIQSTTQQFLDIHDITNDMVVLKDGSTSIVLTVNAMNFGLLAEAEQDAVIYSYAALLNSLNYPIQIVIRSQTKDASSYLQLLQEQEDQSADRIKKDWIRRYKEFVGNLIHERNVLDKKFYVVIPASSLEMGVTPAQNLVSGFKTQSIEGVEKSVILEKARALLEPKRDHLIAQFNRIGLYARQLKTQEIIQLFYTSYNPEAAEGQQITDSRSYTTPLVEAQIRGVNMTNATTDPNVSAATPTSDAAMPATAPTPTPTAPPVESITGIQPQTSPDAGMTNMPSMSATPAEPAVPTPSAPTPAAPTPMAPPTTPGPVPTPSMAPITMSSSPAPNQLNNPMSTQPISITPTPAPAANPNPMMSGVSEPMATALNPTNPPASNMPSSAPTPPNAPAPLSTPATSNTPPSITESPIVTAPRNAAAASGPTGSTGSAASAGTPTATSETQIQNELDSALKELGSAGGAAKAGPATPPTMPTPSRPTATTGGATPAAADDELPPLPEI